MEEAGVRWGWVDFGEGAGIDKGKARGIGAGEPLDEIEFGHE